MKKGVRFKILVGIGVLLVILLIALLSIPKIILVDNDVTVNLEEDYIEPGYKAKVLWFDITNKVTVTNNIDTNVVGNYEVEYKIDLLFDIVKKRSVIVIETIPPEITLVGEESVYVCPQSIYEEEGYEAIDNYDGDVTDKVTLDVKDDMITYIVVDSSNNETSKTRTIIHEDNVAPNLELKGNESITLTLGSGYSDPGYTATDNCLGDITDKVVVEGSVNTNAVGTYTITHKVSDGVNETSKTRTIHVINGIATLGTENAPGVIYLTFDDGPSNSYTRIVLDTLKKYNVKATFFLVPKNASLYYLIKEEYDSGHSLGIHSMSHTYSVVYASDDNLYSDIKAVNEVIKNVTGSYTYLYRYPGGSSNTVSKNYSTGIMSRSASVIHEMGYHYFDWNISSGDADGRNHTSDEIANNVIRNLSKSRYNVVLMHDTHEFTAYAVEKIILYALENGYTFAPITMNTREVHHSIAN
ncbi:MAG: polysaccharide deacetylase family protein [Bacilli bacterium]|nr:polysaccharide deacetylase family protein [Bacilli bacterium]